MLWVLLWRSFCITQHTFLVFFIVCKFAAHGPLLMVVHSLRHVHSNYLQLGFPSILNITHQHTPKQSSTISRLPKHPAIFSDNDWGVKSPQHNIQVLSPFSEGDCIPRVFRTILHQKLYSNPHFPRKNGWKLNCKGLNRGFPKMVVPPKHPKMILFRRKTLVVGYHHFRKPPNGGLGLSFWLPSSSIPWNPWAPRTIQFSSADLAVKGSGSAPMICEATQAVGKLQTVRSWAQKHGTFWQNFASPNCWWKKYGGHQLILLKISLFTTVVICPRWLFGISSVNSIIVSKVAFVSTDLGELYFTNLEGFRPCDALHNLARCMNGYKWHISYIVCPWLLTMYWGEALKLEPSKRTHVYHLSPRHMVWLTNATVDGRNSSPPGMCETLKVMG